MADNGRRDDRRRNQHIEREIDDASGPFFPVASCSVDRIFARTNKLLHIRTERADFGCLHFYEIIVVAALPLGEYLWQSARDVWCHDSSLDEMFLEERNDARVPL